jgi:purine nucleosidase
MLPALAQYADSNDNAGEPPVHDVCAVVSVTDPSVFTYTPALVHVETTGTWTSGMTVTDFEATDSQNALVATDIDADKFWDVVLGTYGSLAGSMDQRP